MRIRGLSVLAGIVALALSGCLDSRIQQRVETLEQQIEAKPTNAEAHRELGQVWFDEGHDEKAIEHLSMAAKLEPQKGETLTLLGTVYARTGDYRNAVAVLTAVRPGTAKNDLALGSALLGAGLHEEGIESLKRALKQDPSLAPLVNTAMGNAGATSMQNASPQDQALEEALENVYQDLKEQMRQEVREQIAEDLILKP